MNKTSIEWVKNPDGTQGYTWNPITGCLNGCPYCYARKLANGWLKPLYLANENTVMKFSDGYAPMRLKVTDPFYPRLWPKRLEEQLGVYPRGIFVCDMGELFGDWVPDDWIGQVLHKMTAVNYQQHRFYLLTKQPQNLIKWSPFPENCWVGVTATNQQMLDASMPYLLQIEATVRFASFEPLLERIDVSWYLRDPNYNDGSWYQDSKGVERWDLGGAPCNPLDWLIIGAQTKPYKPPKIEWVQEIVQAADRAGVSVFLKDNLWSIFPDDEIIPTWAQMEKGKYRQELP